MNVPRLWLAGGIVAGALCAAIGLRAPDRAALPEDAVARVGDRLIARDGYLRAVAAVEADRRSPLSPDERRRVLERLIDEELLVQRGLALGLPESDARVRSTLVSEVMNTTGLAARPVLDATALQQHYRDHLDRFSPAGRLHVRAARFVGGVAQPHSPPVPDGLLPPAKLEAYLGPALVREVLDLQAGERRVVETPAGAVELTLVAREPGAPLPFEQVREAVRQDALRVADEAAVRALLDRLREERPVIVAPQLP